MVNNDEPILVSFNETTGQLYQVERVYRDKNGMLLVLSNTASVSPTATSSDLTGEQRFWPYVQVEKIIQKDIIQGHPKIRGRSPWAAINSNRRKKQWHR